MTHNQGTHFTVRVANEGDYDGLCQLFENSYPVLLSETYDPHEIEAVIQTLVTPKWELLRSGTYYVAVANDSCTIIGSGGWSWNDPLIPGQPAADDSAQSVQHGKTANLRHFATSASWTRRSVGRAIFNRCLHECRQRGANRMMVYGTINSIPFYTRMGFKKQSDVRLPIGPYGFRAMILTQNL